MTVILVSILLTSSSSIFPTVSAAQFLVRTSQTTFSPSDVLVIYGRAVANDTLAVALLDPGGRSILIDTVAADTSGAFSKQIFVWPQASRSLVYGVYLLRVSSSIGALNVQEIALTFADKLDSSSQGTGSPAATIQHYLSVKLDSPVQTSTNSVFRIFVQVTFDGALVNADPTTLLGSSHIHSGNQTINLANKFSKLHEGIYYSDVILTTPGSYIVHAIAFHRGFLAHDSKVVTSSTSSIGSIQDTVNELNTKLTSTNKELTVLQNQLTKTDSALNDTRYTISTSLDNARNSIAKDIQSAQDNVKDIAQSSGQITSLILPILALISVIIALQISLFARIRASYR